MTANVRAWVVCVALVGLCAGAASADIVLQDGVDGYAGTRDTYMAQGTAAYDNYNTLDRMQVTGYNDLQNGSICRSIVKFDLTSVPAGTNIVSAKLYLYSFNTDMMRGTTGEYGLYRITQSWLAGQVCWAYRQSNPLIAWAPWGGEFEVTPDAVAPKNPVKEVFWYEWDVTDRVKQWVLDGSTNFGWIVKVTDENLHNQEQFRTKEAGLPGYSDKRPKLVIVTSAPKAGDVDGDGFVDVVDLLYLVDAFGSLEGDSNWDPRCDFNGDLAVDVVDLLDLVANFGT